MHREGLNLLGEKPGVGESQGGGGATCGPVPAAQRSAERESTCSGRSAGGRATTLSLKTAEVFDL